MPSTFSRNVYAALSHRHTHVLARTHRFPITVCSRLQPKREVENSERASRFLKLVYQEFGVRDVKEKADLEEEVHTLENVVGAMDERLRESSELQAESLRVIQELFAKVTSLQDTVKGLAEELSHRNTAT